MNLLRPFSENELKKIIKEVHEVDQSIMLGDQPDVNAISMEDDVLEILGQLRVAAEVQERAALHEGPGALVESFDIEPFSDSSAK